MLYSTDMKYTSLRLSDNYNYSLLLDLAVPASWWFHPHPKCSTLVSMCLFLNTPTIAPNYLKTTSPGRAAISSSTYSTHTSLQCNKPNRLRCGKCKGTSAEDPSPTKRKQNGNIQQYCCITIIQGFIWLEARHISSGLTHHIHNIKLPLILILTFTVTLL